MSEEKNSTQPSGPNWLFGLDKLTTPSLDYVGLKLRDKLRAYLSEKARDRAILRRHEKEFLYRQIDLMNYGADQYAAYLESMGDAIFNRHFQNTLPLIHFAISNYNISPERAFDSVITGFNSKHTDLTGGELILSSAAAGAMDIILTLQVTKLMFQFANVASTVHLQSPNVTDEQFEEMIQDEATLAALNDAMPFSDWGVAKWFAKTFTEIYGFEWDEQKFNACGASGNLD